MTNDISTTAHRIAADIIDALPNDDMLAELVTDQGLVVEHDGATWVVWLRPIDGRIVVWGGNDVDEDMNALLEVAIDKPCPCELHDYHTGDVLRAATWTELARSVAAADDDGGRGVIDVDGGSAYVA
jgi:hypothetical protein